MSAVEKKFLFWNVIGGGPKQFKSIEDFFEEESGRNSLRIQIMSQTL